MNEFAYLPVLCTHVVSHGKFKTYRRRAQSLSGEGVLSCAVRPEDFLCNSAAETLVSFMSFYGVLAYNCPYILISVASTHKCNRVCEENKPMICEYNFTVENYLVLSKVCFG